MIPATKTNKAKRKGKNRFSPEERQVYALIEDGKADLDQGRDSVGIEKLSMALLNADKLDDKRFSVNSRRALANGYKVDACTRCVCMFEINALFNRSCMSLFRI